MELRPDLDAGARRGFRRYVRGLIPDRRGHQGGGLPAIDERVTVLIADDHPPTRAGIRSSLEDNGFVVCFEASTAKSAIEGALKHKPDVCLLDVHMPDSGIKAARQISAALPATAIVMLTVSRDDEDLFDALRAGAAGYLLKDTDPERLPIALRGVLKGEGAIPRALVRRLIDEVRDHGQRRTMPVPGKQSVRLTSREWEVISLLRQGVDTQEIARRLFVSPVTVRTHVASVMKKMKAPTREAALKQLEEQERATDRRLES